MLQVLMGQGWNVELQGVVATPFGKHVRIDSKKNTKVGIYSPPLGLWSLVSELQPHLRKDYWNSITYNIQFSSQTYFNSLKEQGWLTFMFWYLRSKSGVCPIQCFFNCENLANFHLKNMILSCTKDFFMEKLTWIRQISREKKIQNCHFFNDKFQ